MLFQGPRLGQGICGVGGVCLLASLATATGFMMLLSAARESFTATRSASTRTGIARYCMYVQHGWLVGGYGRQKEMYVEG